MKKRSLSSFSLLFASISAIIGSGWLFSSYYAVIYAGPDAIFSWLIGGLCIMVIAFVFAEISSLIPVAGSSSRIPYFTHGTLVSFTFSWIIWLSYSTLAPTEVQAIIQYLSFFFPSLTDKQEALTHNGYLLAITLMLAMSIINIYSLRWLIRMNNAITAIKISLPVVISIIILYLFLPSGTTHNTQTFTFTSHHIHGMFQAIASGGIIFAFNGFKQACEMAGDATNPGKSLPFAIIGSILICLIIYLLLQTAFIVSMTDQNLHDGWAHLILHHASSPLSAVVMQDHLPWLIPFLYIGAVIGPLAAGLMYILSSSKSLYAQSKNHVLPAFLQITNKDGNPVYAIIVTFFIGLICFLPLPGWDKMVSFLTSLMAITYAIAPISLLALRQQVPHYQRPFKLPFATTWSTMAFFFCNLFSYWSGWAVISKLSITLSFGFLLLFIHRSLTPRNERVQLDWQPALWLLPYFVGLIGLSYLGNFGGGAHVLPNGWDNLIIFIFSLIIIRLSLVATLPSSRSAILIDEALTPKQSMQ